jgi:hypothetical protein
MDRVPDSVWLEELLKQLDRCDRAWRISEVLRDGSQPIPSRIESITGDIDRTIFQSDPIRAAQIYREVYLLEVDYLAETLFVPNYRREDVRRYAFNRAGTEFIMSVPGPADTAIGTRILFHTGGHAAWR